MRQLGIIFLLLALFTGIFSYFEIFTSGIWWEVLFVLFGVIASLWVSDFKKIMDWGLHWRIALLIASLSAFLLLSMLINALIPVESYTISITYLLFSLTAFVFQYLDRRKK